MSNNILEIKNFSKEFRSNWTFSKIPAVNNLSLDIKQGEIFGFLGHNGAGKSTTIKCIVGLHKPTSGQILFNGQPVAENKKHIGYLPEHPYFYDHLTVKETLTFFAQLLDINEKNKVEAVIEELGLCERKNQKVKELSKGWQQRLGFAQAILNDPKLLILDEPFSGLDPVARKMIRDIIYNRNKQGTTVFMTSHILSDVNEICQRVIIMNKGNIVREVNLKEWNKTSAKSYELTISREDQVKIENELNYTEKTNSKFSFDSYEASSEALKLCVGKNIEIISFEKKVPSLEEVFIESSNQSSKSK